MDAAQVIVVVVAGLAFSVVAGAAGAWLLAARLRPGGPVEREARRADEQRRAAEHQATVRAAVDAAVDTVVKVAGERLGAQAEAGSRELAARQHSFDQRVGQLSGALDRPDGPAVGHGRTAHGRRAGRAHPRDRAGGDAAA